MFGVVESMRKLSCAECCYLDKSKKEMGKYGSYIYGCKSTNRNSVVGYTKKDSELKTMGCSYCNKIKVGTRFMLNKTKEQIESLKQTARFYKKRVIKREEENRR